MNEVQTGRFRTTFVIQELLVNSATKRALLGVVLSLDLYSTRTKPLAVLDAATEIKRCVAESRAATVSILPVGCRRTAR